MYRTLDMKAFVILLLLVIGESATAHQFTPTYPKLEPSFVNGVVKAEMELFNSRSDVRFYELSVHDADWNDIPFASESKVVEVPYLNRKVLNIHIREKDRNKAVYICSKSKLLGSGSNLTMVSSKICSKIK